MHTAGVKRENSEPSGAVPTKKRNLRRLKSRRSGGRGGDAAGRLRGEQKRRREQERTQLGFGGTGRGGRWLGRGSVVGLADATACVGTAACAATAAAGRAGNGGSGRDAGLRRDQNQGQ